MQPGFLGPRGSGVQSVYTRDASRPRGSSEPEGVGSRRRACTPRRNCISLHRRQALRRDLPFSVGTNYADLFINLYRISLWFHVQRVPNYPLHMFLESIATDFWISIEIHLCKVPWRWCTRLLAHAVRGCRLSEPSGPPCLGTPQHLTVPATSAGLGSAHNSYKCAATPSF